MPVAVVRAVVAAARASLLLRTVVADIVQLPLPRQMRKMKRRKKLRKKKKKRGGRDFALAGLEWFARNQRCVLRTL